jgi:hypothetical protein
MRFAKVVFTAAGVWGVVVLTPLYFLLDVTGREYAPPADYPHFFYGFLAVTMAWQIAFLVIGSQPARFRPLMIPAIIEKLGYVVATALLSGPGAHLSGGRDDCLARPAAWDPLHRRVLEDCAVGATRQLTRAHNVQDRR